nr:MAG TPA: hypothetical protein [Caudoviricetes sp.]
MNVREPLCGKGSFFIANGSCLLLKQLPLVKYL